MTTGRINQVANPLFVASWPLWGRNPWASPLNSREALCPPGTGPLATGYGTEGKTSPRLGKGFSSEDG